MCGGGRGGGTRAHACSITSTHSSSSSARRRTTARAFRRLQPPPSRARRSATRPCVRACSRWRRAEEGRGALAPVLALRAGLQRDREAGAWESRQDTAAGSRGRLRHTANTADTRALLALLATLRPPTYHPVSSECTRCVPSCRPHWRAFRKHRHGVCVPAAAALALAAPSGPGVRCLRWFATRARAGHPGRARSADTWPPHLYPLRPHLHAPHPSEGAARCCVFGATSKFQRPEYSKRARAPGWRECVFPARPRRCSWRAHVHTNRAQLGALSMRPRAHAADGSRAIGGERGHPHWAATFPPYSRRSASFSCAASYDRCQMREGPATPVKRAP